MIKRSTLLWVLIALLSVLISVLTFLPATWLGVLLEKQSNGRVILGDVQGSFWKGSAFVGVASDKNSPVSPLFPGRFNWKISPSILLGRVSAQLENAQAMSGIVNVEGSFTELQLSPASIKLPSERLEGLGAPLNTIGPSGQILLRWNQLHLILTDGKASMTGLTQLEMSDMTSRASSVKPLGSYYLALQWHGDSADLVLSTNKGPMMLEGTGSLNNGHLRFSGKAYAETGQEEKMANLLNLLGRRRLEGDKQIIALEYK